MPKRTHNVKLEDGNHELFFDNESLYEFEAIHGDTAMNVIGKGNVGFRAITNLVWAGLLHNEKVPISTVKKIVPAKISKFESVTTAVIKAVEDALGMDEEEEEEDSGKNDKADRQK